jgi:lysylphosphatidylglycerol synthetase-like protein (DUF2156 family)
MTTFNDTLHGLCKNEPRCILEGFYGALHALDITASAVLIFAGTLIVAAAHAAHRPQVTADERRWALIVMLLSLVAAGLCLRIAQISYPFHGYVTKAQPDPYAEEFTQLDKEVWLRTLLFWIATGLSALAVVIPIGRALHELLPKWHVGIIIGGLMLGVALWIGESLLTYLHLPS